MPPDLPTRLRRWTHAVDAVPASDIMDEAAAEIERLRWRVMTLESAARYAEGRSVKTSAEKTFGSGTVTPAADHENDEKRAVCDMKGPLTDAEREAVEQAIDAANGMGQAEPWTMRTLRGLLERMGGER